MAKMIVANVKPNTLTARLAALLKEKGFEADVIKTYNFRSSDEARWIAFGVDSQGRISNVLSVHSMKECIDQGITDIFMGEVWAYYEEFNSPDFWYMPQNKYFKSR
jgi:hypothetical protein